MTAKALMKSYPVRVNLPGSVEGFAQVGMGRPYQADDVQKFPIGTVIQLGIDKFVYGKAAGTLSPNMAAKIKNPQDISQEILGAAADEGDTEITLTLDNTDGPSYDGLLPENYLAGGRVVIFPATGSCMVRGILSNSAVTVNAGTATFTVELDAPVYKALTVADKAEAIASPWAAVVPNTATKLADNLCSVCGIPTCDAVDGQFLWFQIGGITWDSPDAALGAGTNNRAARYNGDGSMSDGDDTNTTVIAQDAGFVLANDKANGQGAPFVMLVPMV